MKTSSKQLQQTFMNSLAAIELRQELVAMEKDPAFITASTYMPTTKTSISFSDKHFAYMSMHQDIQPRDYMNNLRLKTRIR
jgi:hypothetical protein